MKETFETTANELGGQAEVLVEKLSWILVNETDKVTQYAISSALALGLKGIPVLLVVVQMANIMNQYGIPSVILGVGYENIHTTSERIAIKDMYMLTRQIIKIIELVAE